MLSQELKELYDGYYSKGVKKKRLLSAVDSVREIKLITEGLQIKKLLDVGSGDGTVLEQIEKAKIAESLSVAEISSSSIEIIKNRSLKSLDEIKQFDGYEIPYEDKAFDLAMATYVLEHVEHERLFLKEMARVANYVMISVPLENTKSIAKALVAGKKIGHINFYTIETFKSILETSGLEVVEIKSYTTSKAYEVHCSKKYGRYKFMIRNAALKFFPKIARRNFTYMGIALCKTKPS